ncbi:MAG TPA: heavy metal-binding domain-containing protein [Ktedonobacterales bacterium]
MAKGAKSSGPDPDVPLDQRNGPQELPPDAKERLDELRGEGGKKSLFTSDLSVSELALLHDAGFEPLGLVIGSSIYHIGWQPMWSSYSGFGYNVPRDSGELQTLTQAKYEARELAMARMEGEADALGADGVIGVRLTVGKYDWGADLAEFMAIGTAVRARKPGAYRTKFNKPFTSDLSGQEFATLLKSGHRPLGLVMGVSVYGTWQNGWDFQRMSGWQFGWTGSFAAGAANSGYNQEISLFTDGVYMARDLAMNRMTQEARELGAEGVVGMRVEMQPTLSKGDAEFWEELNDKDAGPPQYHWRLFAVDMFAIGTAIVAAPVPQTPAPPGMILFLDK